MCPCRLLRMLEKKRYDYIQDHITAKIVWDLNKRKWFLWYRYLKDTNERYENMVFTNECTVQLECHSWVCFIKQCQYRLLKPRAKHSIKIHVWGGISSCGATNVMFSSIMDTLWYQQILEVGLPLFLNECFPDGHCVLLAGQWLQTL